MKKTPKQLMDEFFQTHHYQVPKTKKEAKDATTTEVPSKKV